MNRCTLNIKKNSSGRHGSTAYNPSTWDTEEEIMSVFYLCVCVCLFVCLSVSLSFCLSLPPSLPAPLEIPKFPYLSLCFHMGFWICSIVSPGLFCLTPTCYTAMCRISQEVGCGLSFPQDCRVQRKQQEFLSC